MPKDPPKRAKRKEIEGQAILTLEPLTMEKLESQGKKINPKNPKTQKQKQKKRERKSEIYHSLCLHRKEKRSRK